MTEWFLAAAGMAAGSLRILTGLSVVLRLFSADNSWKFKSLARDLRRRILRAAVGGAMGIGLLLAAIHLFASALTGEHLTGIWPGSLDEPPYPAIALEAFWISTCAGRLTGISRQRGLSAAVSFGIGSALGQFVTAAWLGVLFRSPYFFSPNAVEGQISVWLFHGLMILTAGMWLGEAEKDRPKRRGGISRPVTIMAVAGLLSVVTLSEQNRLPLGDDLLYSWTILAVVLMMSLLLFSLHRQYEAEKEIARLESEQVQFLKRDYKVLSSAYSANARLFHDFHHHIGALQQLMAGGKYQEAAAYLDELRAPVQNLRSGYFTGDETADYLISAWSAAAAEAGVPTEIEAEFPRHTNIRSVDLCTILGNLLDNALEAAAAVSKPDERFIRLTIRRINQMVIIRVENSFSAPLKERGGELETTKKGGLHGWGLRSARAAAEKYDGTVKVSCERNVFRAIALLSYGEAGGRGGQ